MSESFGNYNLVKRFKLDFTDIVVSKWRSSVTGFSVIHIDYDAPIVSVDILVRTEIFDDSGCPHTLEHLVFMGSEKYPYKGILHLFAHRAFCKTSAHTGVDQTAYHVLAAGGQGFLQFLPIFLDHILYPTITEAGFITEVHHIDGKGHDAGVVYCEMQSFENTLREIMFNKSKHLLYAPDSGYRSQTAGLMAALRTLSPEQIRKYYSNYYGPHNMALMVFGKLAEGTSSLLRVVQEQVEPSLIQHNQNQGSRPAGWKRPFVETPSGQRKPIPATTKTVVEFPDKDESMGAVMIYFVGPPPNDFLTRTALDILGEYLTSSPVAPLNKEYIEIESPLCSDFDFDETCCARYVNLEIEVTSVPTEHLDTFNEKLTASLKRIVENGIDMQRMAMVIDSAERLLHRKLEAEKGGYFYEVFYTDFLYNAEDGSELHPSMDTVTYYNILRSWTSSQWTTLLSKTYVEQHSAVVIGKPSASLVDNLEQAEKARIASQVEKLGPEGLKEAERRLEAAKKDHSKPIPPEILASFPIPDVKSISWIPVQTVLEPGEGRTAKRHVASTNGELQRHIESDGTSLPFFVEYDHVESDFVGVHAFFSLAKLPNHLRPYMHIYLEAFFSLPVVRHNGVRLTHEEVVNQLDNDTVSYKAQLGVSQCFRNTFRVSIEVEHPAYETAVAWLRDLVFGSEFDQERLQVVLAKLQQVVPKSKRNGCDVLYSMWYDQVFAENSTPRYRGVLQKAETTFKLIQRFQESPEDVLADFESIRKHITDPSGIRFSVAGNILGIKKPRSTWAKYFGMSLPPTLLSPVPLANETLCRNLSGQAIVMSLAAIETTYTLHTTKSIQGFDHPEYPVMQLALTILDAKEGDLVRRIRGSGLSYESYMKWDAESGLLDFMLYRSTNAMKALEEAASLMRGFVDGSIELTDTTVAAAMSTVVYDVAKRSSKPSHAARVSFINQALKGVSSTHHIDLLEKCRTVKKEDILAAFEKYFLPIFDPASSAVVVVTAPGNAQSIVERLTALGFDVAQKELGI